MALLSPEYLELNKALHASREDYGSGAFRHSELITNLRQEIGAETVLDYGCGKGTLGYALGKPGWLTEYDPAIPGKDEIPTGNYDLVVCTDVLEHIEPDSLDDVLEHLRQLAKKALFVVIATRASTKELEDGRNAHLIVEDGAWWRERLERHFDVLSWSAEGHETVAVLKRLHTLGDIRVISAVSDTIRFEQATRNIGIVPRRIYLEPRHEKRVVIAGFGPSLRTSVAGIKAEQEAGCLVISVSGAHDFLITHGVIPDIHIDCDPREHKGFFTKVPHPRIRYWMASCCHPSVIDNLIGYDLTLWHVHNGDEDVRIVNELDRDGFLVCGGGSVGCRAMNVMFTQGYRNFSLYGMDCSFSEDGDQHAGPHSGKHQKGLKAKCGGRWYKTSGTLVAIAKSMIESVGILEKVSRMNGEPQPHDGDCIRVDIHGNGLLPAMALLGHSDVGMAVDNMADFSREAAEAA